MSNLNRFAKGVAGAVSLNYCRAGGKHCSSQCTHHPINEGSCYGIGIEKLRPSVALGLAHREATPPAIVTERALDELRARDFDVPWFRFSSSGSLPQPSQARKSDRFQESLSMLVLALYARHVPTHFPVESPEKATYYQALVGKAAIVRLSCQTEAQWLSWPGATSYVAGGDITTGKHIRARRFKAAQDAARKRRTETGRPAMVCPGIRNGTERETKHCGQCTACARQIDIVYPLH